MPVTLSFEAKKIAGKPFVMDARPDVTHVLRSPVFTRFPSRRVTVNIELHFDPAMTEIRQRF